MSLFATLRPATLVLAGCMSFGAVSSASAQARPSYDESDSWYRSAHDAGYSAGLERGESDARARIAFDYTRDPNYQRADIGYRRELTSVDRYRRVFRQGFASGYDDGYRGYRNDVRGASRQPRDTDDVRRAASSDIAYEFGFADGYKAGVEDVRDNDKFNPTDNDEYRDGDRGYERRYGERNVYRVEYRDGFHAGYARGYREGRP